MVVVDTRCLRRPINADIGGQVVSLVTIGHVAAALHRETWTIRNWTDLGLFPKAPVILETGLNCTRRTLYPVPFVDQLCVIGNRAYMGRRMDREHWDRFYADVMAAHALYVAPLLPAGVTDGLLISPSDLRDGRLTTA